MFDPSRGLPGRVTRGAPEACTPFITYAPSPSALSNISHQQNQLSFNALVFDSLQVQFPLIKSPPTPLPPQNQNQNQKINGKGRERFQTLPGLDYSGRGWPHRYWLPNLLKREYVALRFVAQTSYEKATQMCIISAEYAQMMWGFGLQQPFVRLQKTARRSGRSLEGCRRRCGARI